MKIKTSITLSENILKTLSEVAGDEKNRSQLIEEALRLFLHKKVRQIREEKDLQILNSRADALNEEAEDVLSYQVEL